MHRVPWRFVFVSCVNLWICSLVLIWAGWHHKWQSLGGCYFSVHNFLPPRERTMPVFSEAEYTVCQSWNKKVKWNSGVDCVDGVDQAGCLRNAGNASKPKTSKCYKNAERNQKCLEKQQQFHRMILHIWMKNHLLSSSRWHWSLGHL